MRIWLTGGSGSGKTEVAALFAAAGYRVVDADRIAREVAEPFSRAYGEILAAFGTEICLSDGRLDRRALGNMVFSDKEKLAVLNAITHPYIIEEMEKESEGAKNVVYDAPLPNTFGVRCDKTLYVTAPQKVRIERISARDGISPEEAKARILAQSADAVYREGADAILQNDGGKKALFEKTQHFIKEWFSA